MVLFLALIGCNSGTASCESYVEAYNACSDQYLGTTITSEDLGCETADSEDGDYYDCLAEAYDGADCTEEEGWIAAAEDGSECEAPVAE